MVLEAIISDIHQNELALEVALVDIARQGIKQIKNLGDLFGYGPWPIECFERVANNSQIVTNLLGNHDSVLFYLLKGQVDIKVISRYMKNGAPHMGWTYERVRKDSKYSRKILEFLGDLKPSQKDNGRVYAHNEIIHPGEEKKSGVWRYTCDIDEEKHFARVGISVSEQCEHASKNGIKQAFVGHSHIPRVYDKRFGVQMANAGSIGIPRFDPEMRASYLIHDTETGEIKVRKLHYSWVYTRAKMLREKLPDKFKP